MTRRKLFLFFGLMFVLGWVKTSNAQTVAQSSVGIALSEYCVSNVGLTGSPQSDNFSGTRGDWVELYSSFSAVVNLGTYYLSNEKTNLFKWKFPNNLMISPGQRLIVWLTGKNITTGGELHTNFNIDQCKNQYLILSTQSGAVRDSVQVQRTQAGHSRGRVNFSEIGRDAWKIFPVPTYSVANMGPSFISYAPQPIMKFVTGTLPNPFSGTNPGGFFTTDVPQSVNISLGNGVVSQADGVLFDTLGCFRIYYTIDNGEYPVVGDPNTIKLLDTLVDLSNPATLIRAISVPVSSGDPLNPTGCELAYLPSFCETNTYFTHENYQNFSPDFGVVSIAMDKADTSWLNSSAAGVQPVVHVEYYDKKVQIAEGYAQLNRPVQEAWITDQKGFYMTIDDRRGFGCNFEGDIFNVAGLGTTDRRVFPTLHLKGGDYESHSMPTSPSVTGERGTGVMDVFLQSLAAKNNLNVNPLHIKPVITFLNGKYMGVYDLREVYDKHYENYYHQQSKDSVDMRFYHGGDGHVTYNDGPGSNFSGPNAFSSVYALGTSQTVNSIANYNNLFKQLDKESFIDYMILNSFAMNGNLYKYDYNIAYARGNQTSKPGNKWHYYLWNTPAIFNFTTLSLPNATIYQDADVSPCFVHNNPNFSSLVTSEAGNGHGAILKNLMSTTNNPIAGTGRYLFQTQYKTRYQDLLNGPLRCDNLLKHFDYIKQLYLKEMQYHEDGTSVPVPGAFITQLDAWDSTMASNRRGIEKRCRFMVEAFKKSGCYSMLGPYPLTVDVEPAGAGSVKLNSVVLDNYIWSGNYFASRMSFKAIPADETFTFHHWEFKNHTPTSPLSADSLAIDFNQSDNVVAVFTDKKGDVTMPSGFTPNGDGINDLFQPLGSAIFSKSFDMSVWNRWGQEVYRSTDPTSGWDGYYKGQEAPTGVYAYLITYKNIFDESKMLKGNLTLIR